jgi:hypothetical protein
MGQRAWALKAAVAASGLWCAVSAQAVVLFNVSFTDPGSTYSAYYADITRNVQAAGADWMSRFNITVNTTLDVNIGFANIPTANGASATSSFVGTSAGIDIFEQGAAAKIKTGVDVNGAAADINFNIGINGYLQNELWFDPDPVAQTAMVPMTKTDARSVFLHEFGHALGFNGWLDGTTGTLPGDFQSTFDQWAQLDNAAPGGPTLFFTGPNAMAEYGGAVPITFGNYAHVANNMPRDGFDLERDLMNGLVFYRGERYQISALDLAIMQDSGLPLAAVPEPASVMMLLSGGLMLAAATRLRRRKIE